MIDEVVCLAIGIREIADQCGEGRTVIQLECREGDSRADVVMLREDVLCGHVQCELSCALEMLANVHELFRERGHRLRVEIVARKAAPVA